MTTLQRYVLFQVPGWLIDIALLTAAIEWWNLPVWVAIAICGLLLVKDFVFYPILRVGYETKEKSGIAKLIGETAVVKQRLDPEGYVLVQGELWKARIAAPNAPLDPGTRVRIAAFEGMLLHVETIDEPRRQGR